MMEHVVALNGRTTSGEFFLCGAASTMIFSLEPSHRGGVDEGTQTDIRSLSPPPL